MMQRVKFNNFRRFENSPEFKLGNITLMVGRNNSGKSTVIKAILLLFEYLKYDRKGMFRFSGGILDAVNIVSFSRALCKSQKAPFIDFSFSLEQYDFEMRVREVERAREGAVAFLQITDRKRALKFVVDYSSSIVSVHFLGEQEDAGGDLIDSLAEVDRQIRILKAEMPEGGEIDIRRNDDMRRLQSKREQLRKQIKEREQSVSSVSGFGVECDMLNLKLPPQGGTRTVFLLQNTDLFNLDQLILTYTNQEESYYDNLSKVNRLSAEDEAVVVRLRALRESGKEIENSFKELRDEVEQWKMYYLGAEVQRQSELFFMRDSHNELAQAVDGFMQARIIPGEMEYEFVAKWMKEFEVGEYFQIRPVTDEAYRFWICDTRDDIDLEKCIPLADKGMGSVHIMALLLKVAYIIRHGQGIKAVAGDENDVVKLEKKQSVLFLEEPELNLHPGLQSKLADLFSEVNKTYGIRFVVETHSEYLIRRTQVLVANEEFYTQEEVDEYNLFRVYYFGLETTPYEMCFQPSGKFDRTFGPGFFNVADDSAIELFKKSV